ncbi:ESPR domain-containing protein [Megamonas hypermegale]|uniref:ESPR domain-containing protein n=1 Tax=Megamonas hypermegale TaxID=158847 RepID=UPI0026ED5951|nr:ESPR domain-containing protein [Megamonas hypermegale]
MNKIYKVIWSKVKHQYVVVSELAHSNGKQSRTAKRSLRSRIAALVVCGAVAAFGMYGALPVQQVFAATGAETTAGQYIAVAVDPDANNDKYWDNTTNRWVNYGEGDTYEYADANGNLHTYNFQTVNGKSYWVRDGYTITIKEDTRFEIKDEQDNLVAPEGNYIIDSNKSDTADSEGLISSSAVVVSDNQNRQTISGALKDVDPGIYGGAVNSGGTEVSSRFFNYYINDNGAGWKDVGNKSSLEGMTNFKTVTMQNDGTYKTADGDTVSTDNLYVIDGQLGAFFNSNGTVYTGSVYGHHNEVLMTGKDGDNFYSYWGTKINDPEQSLSSMTMGDHEKIVNALQSNIDFVNNDIIENINLTEDTTNKNGGTINLQRRGAETGTVEGGITVSSINGTDGKDVAVKFANTVNGEESSFTVNAGSKVVGINNDNVVTGSNEETTTIDGLEINGQKYSFDSKTYTAGDGIKFEGNDGGTISVDLAENSGLHFETENNKKKLANNLKVTAYEEPTETTNLNGGNWTITETDGQDLNRILTNTTLDTEESNRWNKNKDSLITGATIAKDNNVENPNEVADADTEYGRNYKVIDTDGNIVELNDVASANTLQKVATEAEKHTTVTVNGNIAAPTDGTYTDGNLQLKQTVTDGQTQYDVKLNDNISLGDGKIALNGAPTEGDTLINADNKFVVDQDGTTTITVNDGTVMGNNTEMTIGVDGVTITGDGNKGTTTIDGQKITAGGIVLNGEVSEDDVYRGTITGLTNTTTDYDGFATAGRAATEEQLKKASTAATTTVSEGKNIDVTSTVDEEDGHTNYEVSLEDNVSLGNGKITLNGAPAEGDTLINADNKFVVDQDGTTTIAVNDGSVMGNNTTVTVGTDGVTFAGYGNGSTIINGQTIQAGGVFINDNGNGQITRLTNTDLNDPTFATVGRAATEEQLQLATDAATTTVTEGKNIDVASTVDEEDGHTNYEVSLQDNVSLGDGKITLNGAPEEGDTLINADNKFVVD